MFAVSRRYQFALEDAEEINREIERSFVPMLKRAPGFVAYYWIDSGKGIGESLTIFETRIGADASVKIAANWVKMHNLTERLGTPEVLQGEVKAHG